jgi:hypothetical protein
MDGGQVDVAVIDIVVESDLMRLLMVGLLKGVFAGK